MWFMLMIYTWYALDRYTLHSTIEQLTQNLQRSGGGLESCMKEEQIKEFGSAIHIFTHCDRKSYLTKITPIPCFIVLQSNSTHLRYNNIPESTSLPSCDIIIAYSVTWPLCSAEKLGRPVFTSNGIICNYKQGEWHRIFQETSCNLELHS